MPKVSLGRDLSEKQIDKISRDIRIAIVTAEEIRRIGRAETIKHSGMSQANFYKAWNDPSLFRVGQLIRIYEFLNVPEPERRFS